MKIGLTQQVILGPPGTGKTTTLMNLVDDYLKSGIKSEDIALVSFTKKAVNEAAARASEKFKLKRSKFPLFQTVHSLCFHQLGMSKKSLLNKENFIELGEWLGYDLSGQYSMEDGTISTGATPGDKFLFLDNIARVKYIDVKQAWEEQDLDISWHEQERFSKGYKKYKEQTGLIDFTDLLLNYIETGHPTKAKVALIDEAQDLSKAQWLVLQKCFKDVETVTISGDDDQSIFKWSGADLETFLKLEGDKKVLSHSYRLPKCIHKKSSYIIDQVENRFDKKFTSTDQEGAINHVVDLPFAEIKDDESTLILVRNVYLLPRVYAHLKTCGYAYSGRGGLLSVKSDHVAAIKSWELMRKGHALPIEEIRNIYNHLKVGNILSRGFKAKIDEIETTDETFTWETLRDHYGLLKKPIWYESLEGIPYDTREYYRSVLRSNRKISEIPKIHVNTVHGVKGGEADHVIILSDMSKKTYFEFQKDPDSEHRVAYVALTRAKSRCTVILPSSKFYYSY